MTQATMRSPAAPPGLLFFGFLGGPVAWTLHLLLSYFVVANFCPQLGHGGMRGLVIGITVVFALISLASALVGWRELREQHGVAEEPTTRSDFMARSGVIMGVLFAIGIVAEGIPVLLLPLC